MSPPTRPYKAVIEDTAAMVRDPNARALASSRGLDILSLTWEDTARFEGSAVGPNISDMTIQVEHQDPESGARTVTCMPVIRHPNFSDRTGDVPIDRFWVRVGNERGADLDAVTLRRYLGNLRAYLSEPSSWSGEGQSLLAERDTHVLVSAQACFLPVPKEGIATFNPVLFNYQSSEKDPAVLAVLCTREGTSATVVDNVRDGFSEGSAWGQRLFFNTAGKRASLTGQRLSDFVAAEGAAGTPEGAAGAAQEPGARAGLDMVLLLQVPLKHRVEPTRDLDLRGEALCSALMEEEGGSDIEEAVIGHGAVEGPFVELDGLAIERDPRYPIRVTVQLYKATSNGVVSEADMAAIAAQIERIYADATHVGSLVLDGVKGRPTEYDDEGEGKQEPLGWWDDFWKRREASTGEPREKTLERLAALVGYGWMPPSAEALDGTLRKIEQ